MVKPVLPLFLTSCCLSLNVFAGAMGPVEAPTWAWVAAISAGPTWPQGNNFDDTFYLTPDIEKSFLVQPSTNALFYGEVFLGFQRGVMDKIIGQFGLTVAATNNLGVSGIVLDDANVNFANYAFTYNIQHTHVAAKAKLFADMGYWCMPWISGSIGVGINNSTNYNAVPLIFEAVPTPNFTNNTATSFTYTVGAGLQKILTAHWQAGVGYEFADWGNSNLGPAPFQTTNTGISLNHIYTNGLIFNVTYVA